MTDLVVRIAFEEADFTTQELLRAVRQKMADIAQPAFQYGPIKPAKTVPQVEEVVA